MATVTIKNFDRLQSKLTKLSDTDITAVVRQATAFVHGQAKSLVPTDTGQLRSSIHMEVNNIGKNTVQGRVYTNSDHANYVEFGTGIKGKGTYPYPLKNITLVYNNKKWKANIPKIGWRYVSGQKAQPYLMPSLKGAENYVEYLISRGLQQKINSIVGGGK